MPMQSGVVALPNSKQLVAEPVWQHEPFWSPSVPRLRLLW